jgi:RimJ/RimL family protein N-acetyltransferase
LLAVHYGSLLEADPARLADNDEDSSPWRPLSIDGQWGECLTAALSRYRAGLNSALLVLAEGAKLVIDAVAQCAPGGYLLLSEDLGHATEKQVRLCGFKELRGLRRKACMPVDFQLLAAQLRDSGALTWQRPLGQQRALLVATGGLHAPAPALDAATALLREGSFADGEMLAKSARIVAAHGHVDAVLALVRQSRHEPAVFLAACPALHRRLGNETERQPWAEALAAVWAQRTLMRANPAFHRELARAAMQVAQWGLARKALRWGMRVHGENAQDLVLLAWCESNTGGIDRARLLANKVPVRGDRLEGEPELARHLRERLMRAGHSPGLRCVRHPHLPLVLEPLDIHHAPAVHRQYRDPQIALMVGLRPMPGVAEAMQWIEQRRSHRYLIDYAVMHRDAGFIGFVALRLLQPAAGFCFWMGVDHQGQGYGTEAGRMLCELGLSSGLQWVFASAYADNRRSIGALERIGFKRLPIEDDANGDPLAMLAYPGSDDALTISAFEAYRAQERLQLEAEEAAAQGRQPAVPAEVS